MLGFVEGNIETVDHPSLHCHNAANLWQWASSATGEKLIGSNGSGAAQMDMQNAT